MTSATVANERVRSPYRRIKGFGPTIAKPHAQRQLFCFPYAGGGASVYARWQNAIRPDIDVWSVELPGRQTRVDEPLRRELVPLAAEIAGSLASVIRGEYSLLGCSLGARLAFEVAQALRARGVPAPKHFFALAANAPQAPRRTAMWKMQDEELLSTIAVSYGAIAPELLAEPELRRRLLLVLRADLELVENYQCQDPRPLDCPLTFFSGLHDRSVAIDAAYGWRMVTREAFEHRIVEGGHFFVNTASQHMMREVERRLR
jgi:medium-chain acyl-[acyl-carrier-protein] hydrolase